MKMNSNPRLKLVATLVVVIIATITSPGLRGAHAQLTQFRAGIELIEVDVSVVDNRGRPVEDLRAPEFDVTVDGEPRNVVSAEFVQLGTTPGAPSDPQRSEGFYSSNEVPERGRLIILAVDRESIPFGDGAYATQAASRFVDLLGANDRVGFISVPQPRPYVDLTANRARVREAIDGIVGLQQPTMLTSNIGIHEAFAITTRSDQIAAAEAVNRLCGHIPVTSFEWERCSNTVENDARRIINDIRFRTDQSLRQLEAILTALREIEGPKHVIWISAGLPLDGPGARLQLLARLAAAARVTIHVLMLDQPLVSTTSAEAPPSPRQDRDLLEQGLRMLAGTTRGSLRRVGANADTVFGNLEAELSGYYLLGVEARRSDRDGEAHEIGVSVGRRGTNVRARREFVTLAPDSESFPEDVKAAMQRMLHAPFAATELPLKVASYSFQAPDPKKVYVVVVLETEEGGPQPQPATLGYTLVDQDGGFAVSGPHEVALDVVARPGGRRRQHLISLVVEPGSYRLKMAVIDADGRRGSVEHQVQAWQLADVPFATSDLVLADAAMQSGSVLRPPVEARLSSGQLSMYTELYADTAATFDDVQVLLEVAKEESGAPRWFAAGVQTPGSHPNSRTVSAIFPVDTLPPGRYFARAVVRRGDERLARLCTSIRGHCTGHGRRSFACRRRRHRLEYSRTSADPPPGSARQTTGVRASRDAGTARGRVLHGPARRGTPCGSCTDHSDACGKPRWCGPSSLRDG